MGNSTQAASTGKMPYESKNDWNYNTGYESGGGLGASGDAWINAGRSDICVACHSGYDKNENVLDMNPDTTSTADANGDSINNNDRPSCGWEQGTNAEGIWTVRPGCHVGGTDLEKAPLKNSTSYLVDWQWKANGAGGSRSHSHDGNNVGVPCEACHGGHQIQKLPNPLATTLTEQCEFCHDRSDGWLNITQNVAHPLNSECKNCHLDNNKLDPHSVPFGVFGGKWCMDCHNINGKSPVQLDEEVVSSSNPEYIHYELNSGSDATNSSRLCWGCHTNDSVANDGAVNQGELPQSLHPDSYDTPKECTDCHYNTGSTNFSAPQNYRHTWYAPFMVTPDVTYCTDCHKQDEMLMGYNQSATAPTTDNESSAHYGKNRTSFFAPLVGTRAYCAYCHQNETTVMGPFANDANKVRSDHASQPTTPGCGDEVCHKPGRMHEDQLVVPAFAETNIASTCQNSTCHSSVEYKSHNGTLTCWDCHMGNVSDTDPTWIHPIQFIQYNGNFTGAKLTGATCYDCHKSTNVDATTQNLSGKTAPKVNNQAHSNAPNNGTIWGQYWDYTPTTYEFADYNIVGGNGTIDPAYPFENVRVPSNDHLELVETQIGRDFEATFPIGIDDREFIESKGNWTGVVVSGVSISGGYDLSEGNPLGSLYVDRIQDNTIDEYNWTSGQFYYNGSAAGGYYYANFSMDKKVTAFDFQVFTDVVLIRPV
ncbi:MAG: hypothetical protein KAH86_05010, partial [Methanosarcinales archaeon]|nr:hypothetical protein [Methanosarcinales archaeon]